MELDETVLKCSASKTESLDQENVFCIVRVDIRSMKRGPPFILKGQQVIIGRHPQADVLIRSESVSRKHAVLTKTDTSWGIADSQSLNGVWVNKKRLSSLAPLELRSGDIFSLGDPKDTEFCYMFTTQDNALTCSPAEKVAKRDCTQEALKIEEIKQQLQQTLEADLKALRETALLEKEKIEEDLRRKITTELQESLLKEQQRLNKELEQSSQKAQLLEKQLVQTKDLVETELNCAICSELFVQAYTLGCAHTFCKHCITLWKKKKNECPICRTKIKSMAHGLALDNFIDQMVGNLSPSMKEHRITVYKERGLPVSNLAMTVPKQNQSVQQTPSTSIETLQTVNNPQLQQLMLNSNPGQGGSILLNRFVMPSANTTSTLNNTTNVLRPVISSQAQQLILNANPGNGGPIVLNRFVMPSTTATSSSSSNINNTNALRPVSNLQAQQLILNANPGNGGPIVLNRIVMPSTTTTTTPSRGTVRTRGGARGRGGASASRITAVGPIQPHNSLLPGQTTLTVGGGVQTTAIPAGSLHQVAPGIFRFNLRSPGPSQGATMPATTSNASNTSQSSVTTNLNLTSSGNTQVTASVVTTTSSSILVRQASTTSTNTSTTSASSIVSDTPPSTGSSETSSSTTTSDTTSTTSASSTSSDTSTSAVSTETNRNSTENNNPSVIVISDSEDSSVVFNGFGSAESSGLSSSDSDSYEPSYSGGTYYGGYGRCFQCGEKGHWSPGCPYR